MSDDPRPPAPRASSPLVRALKPLARRVLHGSAVTPGPILRVVLRALHDAMWTTREGYEWARRSFVATPLFLAQCESHGADVSVDRMPYMLGRCRIRLGSRIRISGLLTISHSARKTQPLLEIGSDVFIGHGCAFGIAEHISMGDFCSIGAGTTIMDTSGHSHRRLDVPIWEDPPESDDISPVIIEDNVHIGQNCTILKGVRIGARAVIGSKSVVRNNVPPGAIVAGNPARVAGWRPGMEPARAPAAPVAPVSRA